MGALPAPQPPPRGMGWPDPASQGQWGGARGTYFPPMETLKAWGAGVHGPRRLCEEPPAPPWECLRLICPPRPKTSLWGQASDMHSYSSWSWTPSTATRPVGSAETSAVSLCSTSSSPMVSPSLWLPHGSRAPSPVLPRRLCSRIPVRCPQLVCPCTRTRRAARTCPHVHNASTPTHVPPRALGTASEQTPSRFLGPPAAGKWYFM